MVAIIHIHKHMFTSYISTHFYSQYVRSAVYRHHSTLGQPASKWLGRTMKVQKPLSKNPYDSSLLTYLWR